MEDTKHLVYVNPIGRNSNGNNEYELFFSKTPDTVWAEDWNVESPSACVNLIPEEDMYEEIKRIETDIPLKCVQENSCFSIQDCTDRIVAIMWEDINGYEEFPEPYRIVLHYGDDEKKVRTILSGRDIEFKD